MAELNPGIILSGKMPEMPNPLDSAAKALTIGNLVQQNQMGKLQLSAAQRDESDHQALRDAMKKNTVLDPATNMPIVDRQGAMKDLMAANPLLAQKQGLEWRQQDLEKLTQQHGIAKQILFSIDPKSQASVDQAVAQAHHYGLPPLESVLPKDINDPSFESALRSAQIKSLTAEEQISNQFKQQEADNKKLELQLQTKKIEQESHHYREDKQWDAVKTYNAGVSGSRQQPDAVRDLNTVLSAKNLNEIASQAPGGDLNKLNQMQTKMAMGEVLKMTGVSITEGELESMTPNGIVQKYGKILQGATNKSTPANAGEFIQQGIDYGNGLAGVAKSGLTQRSKEMIERTGPTMEPKMRAKIQNQIEHEFDEKKPPKKIMNFDEWKASKK